MVPRFRSATYSIACFAAVVLATACGSDEGPAGAPPEPPPPVTDSGPTLDSGPPLMQPVGGSCPEGEIKDCKVLLPSHGSLHPCFIGVQICTDGKWSICMDPPKDAGSAADGSVVN